MFYCVHLLIVKSEAIQSLVYFTESQNRNVRVLGGILAITLPTHFIDLGAIHAQQRDQIYFCPRPDQGLMELQG